MRTTDSHGKKFTYLLGAAVAGLLAALVAMADLGPPGTDTNFEIDASGTDLAGYLPFADAIDDDGIGSLDDWQTIYCFDTPRPAGCPDPAYINPPNYIATTGIVNDGSTQSIFWKGGSKDIRDVSQWAWKHGSVPDKDDILHAGAAAYVDNDDLIIYIFADRFSNDGDAQMGAWFFQDRVEKVEDVNRPGQGTFSGVHKNGDILWLGHFSGGGVIASMQVWKWNDSRLDNYDGSCGVQESDLCLISEGPIGDYYYASVNTINSDNTAPWPYAPKQGESGYFPYNSFMEGGINLSRILGSAPCFTSVLIETRSSTSLTAQLKDFVLGQIDTCKIEVSKTCTSTLDAEGDEINHDFTITTTNVGYAALDSVGFVDSGYPPAGSGDQSWTWPGISVPGNVTVTGSSPLEPGETVVQTYRINNTTNGITNTVTATGYTAGGFETDEVSGSGTCNAVSDPGLEVTKQCDETLLVLEDGKLNVKVKYSGTVCNTGDVRLTGVKAWDVREGCPAYPASGYCGVGLTSDSLNVGACASYIGEYYPTTLEGANGNEGVVNGFGTGQAAQRWTDTVDAEAIDWLSGLPETAIGFEVTCDLCPTCPTCPSP